MYTLGDKAKNVKSRIIHIEGDPDHPVNRGTLCPKGAGLLDMMHSPESAAASRRCASPAPTSGSASRWDDALTRIAKHMKADRDANFVEKNDKGVTVNRWNTTGLLASSAASNESGYLTVKRRARMGMVALDTQARI